MDQQIYITPVWLHNRAIVRPKGGVGEFVIYRIRLSKTGGGTAKLIPVAKCENPAEWMANSKTVPIREIEKDYEPTGKQMSAIRAPL